MALDDEYKDFFIRNLHDALSGHTSNSVEEALRLRFEGEYNVCVYKPSAPLLCLFVCLSVCLSAAILAGLGSL